VEKDLTLEEFKKLYLEPAMHGLYVRYMTGTTDALDQKVLASMGYGPRFNGFEEPKRRA
jgi:hypothetical protein